MNIQGHIDKNDVLETLKGMERRFGWPLARLIVSALLLLAATPYAAWMVYQTGSAFAQKIMARSDAPFPDQLKSFAADAPPTLLALALLFVAGVGWFMFVRAARTKSYQQRLNAAKAGLTTGKVFLDLTDAHLIIKTAWKTEKIAWAAFDRFEETKTALVFRYADGEFEFIPKNALHPKEPVDKLCARLKARIERPLSRAEAKEGAGLSLAYEHTAEDDKAFQRWRRKEDEKKLPLLRRLLASYPVIIAAFSVLAATACLAFAGAAAQRSVELALTGLLELGLATALMLTNMPAFSQLTALFAFKRKGPYARSTAVTVTLTKTAVFRETRGQKEAIQWEAFEQLVETKEVAYLVLTAINAIALPKRAFLDEAHYQGFVDFMNCRLAEHKRARETAPMRRVGKPGAAKPAKGAAPKSAPKPSAKPAPVAARTEPPLTAPTKKTPPQKSRQSSAAPAGGNRGAPSHKPRQPIRAVLAR